MMVYTGPDFLESSLHDLEFMIRGKRLISGFQHLKKMSTIFLLGDLVCVALITFVLSSCFYKRIWFVSLSFYQNCHVSNRRAYLQSEEHINRSTDGFISENHIYVRVEE